MFGSLKKLFSRQPADVPPAPKSVSAPAPPPKPSTPPPARPTAPVAKAAPAAASPVQVPAVVLAPPAPSAQAAGSSSPGGVSEEKLVLALKSVVARIPAELMPLVKSTSGNLEFPLQRILDQLPQGSVRFSLAEIRAVAPSGTFGDIAAYGTTQVELPLQTILSLIGPGALVRRAPVKRLQAPAEVGDLFGPKGEAKILPQSLAGARPAVLPTPSAPAPLAPSAPAPVVPAVPKAVAPAAGLPKPPPSAPAPSAPIKSTTPLPTPPLPKLSAPAAPLASIPSLGISGAKLPPPSAPAQPKLPLPAAASTGLPKPATPTLPTSIPKPPTPPGLPKSPTPPTSSAKPAPALQVALPDISGAWPDVVRNEIITFSREQSLVALPFDLVDRGLRSGRLLFTWKQIGEWLKPEPITGSPHGEETVEIPLAVIAPRYLAQFKPNRPQKKIVIGDNIPDIFAGQQRKMAVQTPSVETPMAPAPAPLPTPAPVPVASDPTPAPAALVPVAEVPVPAAVPLVQSVAEIFGQPGKLAWTFNEFVQGTVELPGVSGAVIGSQDGLLVAGQLPAPFSSDTVAAFMPQMFGRINQYAAELKAGDLTVITLGFGPVSWQILRTGELYFAAMSKAGEVLPTAQLATIATELGRQKK